MQIIVVKKAFAPADIINVTINGECQHADTQTRLTSDWFGDDIEVTTCYFCGEEL